MELDGDESKMHEHGLSRWKPGSHSPNIHHDTKSPHSIHRTLDRWSLETDLWSGDSKEPRRRRHAMGTLLNKAILYGGRKALNAILATDTSSNLSKAQSILVLFLVRGFEGSRVQCWRPMSRYLWMGCN